ncbi:hypothetical protein FD725_31075 (plasmid) [Nostoc sp. TCL26-01]|nr:hypothetical protein FD725_31075 [Nostoc sp. TCL26-01]
MMKDVKPTELNQRTYSLPLRLGLIVKLSVAGALVCAIAGHIGDGMAKKEICFYPKSARIHDAPILAGEGSPEELLLGKKYCKYEQRSQIPEPYLKANQYRTSNPNYNPWAFLQHESLYVFRELPADNPFKIHLGIAAIAFGGIGLWATSKAQDYLADIRPHYRATKQFEGIRASYSVKLGEQLLDLSGNELLKYLRGIKIAEARQQFIASITPQQQTALLMAMSADDYYEFGHLLDGGQSFEKFEPQQQPAAQLPHGTPGTVQEQVQQSTFAPQPVSTGDYLHSSETEALTTLQTIARSDGSTALVAAPGSGKSVTLDYLIQRILDDDNSADIWVISAKNDRFCGLRDKGRVIVFDQEQPESAKRTIDHFYNSYKQRKQLPEHKRESLPPLILILDDWLVIADQLSKAYSDWNYGSKLLDVLLIGREFNTKFFASLQSFNLAALGIEKMDSQTRLCLNLLLLGNRYIKNGREQESYGVLELILNRGDIIPGKQEREEIKSRYLEIKPISYKNLRPILIASLGGFVVALMPKLSKQSNFIADEKTYLDRVFDLEFKLSDSSQESKPQQQLSEVANKVLEYFQNVRNKVPKTLRDLKKADRLTSYSEQELIAGLKELIQVEKLNSGQNDSYFLPDW